VICTTAVAVVDPVTTEVAVVRIALIVKPVMPVVLVKMMQFVNDLRANMKNPKPDIAWINWLAKNLGD
jgi:hypothetical protein